MDTFRSFQLFEQRRLLDWTHQDKCQWINTGLKDVDEVSSDDADPTQLGVDGCHEDTEHPSLVQVLQCGNKARFFLLPLNLPEEVILQK